MILVPLNVIFYLLEVLYSQKKKKKNVGIVTNSNINYKSCCN